jgi:hypothetical protein
MKRGTLWERKVDDFLPQNSPFSHPLKWTHVTRTKATEQCIANVGIKPCSRLRETGMELGEGWGHSPAASSISNPLAALLCNKYVYKYRILATTSIRKGQHLKSQYQLFHLFLGPFNDVLLATHREWGSIYPCMYCDCSNARSKCDRELNWPHTHTHTHTQLSIRLLTYLTRYFNCIQCSIEWKYNSEL